MLSIQWKEHDLTTQCLHWPNFGSSLDGASGSVITNVYFISPAASSNAAGPPRALSSTNPVGATKGNNFISGSSSVFSLGTLSPKTISRPSAGQVMERRTEGMKSYEAGITSGMIVSVLSTEMILEMGSVMFSSSWVVVMERYVWCHDRKSSHSWSQWIAFGWIITLTALIVKRNSWRNMIHSKLQLWNTDVPKINLAILAPIFFSNQYRHLVHCTDLGTSLQFLNHKSLTNTA